MKKLLILITALIFTACMDKRRGGGGGSRWVTLIWSSKAGNYIIKRSLSQGHLLKRYL